MIVSYQLAKARTDESLESGVLLALENRLDNGTIDLNWPTPTRGALSHLAEQCQWQGSLLDQARSLIQAVVQLSSCCTSLCFGLWRLAIGLGWRELTVQFSLWVSE